MLFLSWRWGKATGKLSSAVFEAFVVLYGALWLKWKKRNGSFQQKWHPNVGCTLSCLVCMFCSVFCSPACLLATLIYVWVVKPAFLEYIRMCVHHFQVPPGHTSLVLWNLQRPDLSDKRYSQYKNAKEVCCVLLLIMLFCAALIPK